LDSLGAWLFRCEDPDNEGWISLDFLGFSRPNLDFSMGYVGFLAEENFSRSFAAGAAAPGLEPVFLQCRNAVWLIEQA
jgi:hypothetical protein